MQLCMGDEESVDSIVTWTYPQPRLVTHLSTLPVPLENASEGVKMTFHFYSTLYPILGKYQIQSVFPEIPVR